MSALPPCTLTIVCACKTLLWAIGVGTATGMAIITAYRLASAACPSADKGGRKLLWGNWNGNNEDWNGNDNDYYHHHHHDDDNDNGESPSCNAMQCTSMRRLLPCHIALCMLQGGSSRFHGQLRREQQSFAWPRDISAPCRRSDCLPALCGCLSSPHTATSGVRRCAGLLQSACSVIRVSDNKGVKTLGLRMRSSLSAGGDSAASSSSSAASDGGKS